MEVVVMDIGDKIKAIRNENNLSQEQFAELFNVTRQAVSNWEHSRNYPDMNTLGRISDRFGITFDELIKTDEELIENIDRTRIRAARWRRLFTVVSAVLVIVILAAVMPKLIRKVYYDPEEVIAAGTDEYGCQEGRRLETDIDVFTTLRRPGRRFDSVRSYNCGLGSYDITISQSVFIDKLASVSGKIERNHLQLYDPNVLRLPAGNVFEWSVNSRDISKSLRENLDAEMKKWLEETDTLEGTVSIAQGMAGTPEESKEALSELGQDKYYEAYISFNDTVSYPEALRWIDKYADRAYLPWVAVATDQTHQSGPIGFYTEFSGATRGFDAVRYPYLFGYRGAGDDCGLEDLSAEEACTHFLSMLRYLRDQKTFCKMIEATDMNSNFAIDGLGSMIKYIEKNGLRIYGIAVTARKSDLIEIHKDPAVFSIATEEY